MAADSAWIEFIRYNVWANQTLLRACEALSPEQLAASAAGTYGTIARTLEHLVDSEAQYYSLLTGRRLPPPLRWEDGPAVPDIRAYYAEVGEALVALAGQVSPEAAVHQKWQEGPVTYTALALCIQIVNHGVEHRTNITTIIKALGLPQLRSMAGVIFRAIGRGWEPARYFEALSKVDDFVTNATGRLARRQARSGNL